MNTSLILREFVFYLAYVLSVSKLNQLMNSVMSANLILKVYKSSYEYE